MNRFIIRHTALTLGLLGALAVAYSCKKQEDKNTLPVPDSQHFVYVHYLDQKAAYLGTFSDLSAKTTDNSQGYEFSFGCYLFARKDIVLLPEGKFGDKIYKFTRGARGELVQAGNKTFGQGARPGEVNFASDELAYVMLHGLGKISLLNPQNLEEVGEIDLSSYATQDNNPDLGCNVIRDGKLYVALNQLSTPHTSYPGTGAEVAIVNLKEGKVEKVIKDARTGVVGLFRHSDAIVDERGDIYFYSAGNNFNKAENEGFIRIKKGSDEWDADYLFNLSQTPVKGQAGMGQYIIKFFYAGEGIVYSCLKITDREFNILQKDFQPVKIDLWNKTIEKLNLPLTDSNGSFAIAKYHEFIVFGMSCAGGVGYYTYNTVTGECSQSPVVTAVGVPSSLLAFE